MAAEQIITNALKDVVQEIRVQSLTKHVRNFHGEGASKFSNWLKDMQQLSSTCDSERMCVLATLTLGGSAGTFMARTLKENPRISWEELKKLLKTRYSELTDPFMAKEKCRRMQQRSGESVQNFAERLNTAALDAYDDIRLTHVQETIVDIFQRGVKDDRLARNLIRKKFQTMEEAVKYATEEQRTDRTFEMYRHAQVEEPMEVDIVQEGKEAEKLAQIQETVQKLTKQLDRVSRQMRSAPPPQPSGTQPPRRSQTVLPGNRYSTPPSQHFAGSRHPEFRRYGAPPTADRVPGKHVTAPPTSNGRLPTAPVGSQPPHQSGHTAATSTYRWTTDGRPICIKCGKVGHIGRHCRVPLAN